MPRLVHVALHHQVPLTYLVEHEHHLRQTKEDLQRHNIRFEIHETHRERNLINAEGRATETVAMTASGNEDEREVMNRAVGVARYPRLLMELLDEHVTVGHSVTRPEIKQTPAAVMVNLDELANSECGVRASVPVTVVLCRGGVTLHAGLAHIDADLTEEIAALL